VVRIGEGLHDREGIWANFIEEGLSDLSQGFERGWCEHTRFEEAGFVLHDFIDAVEEEEAH
jgi:hypothetical protein